MKKAQVTMIFLLGLIILIVFGLLMFLKSQLTTQNKLSNTNYDEQTVRTYVESCLEQNLQQGLSLIAEQGGIIYEDQSPYNLTTIQGLRNFGLAYTDQGFRPDLGDMSQSFRIDEDASWGYTFGYTSSSNVGLNPETFSKPQYDGPFAQFSLPKLCKINGANNNSQDNPNLHCKTYYYSGSGSIQEYLEDYVAASMNTCLKNHELPGVDYKKGDSKKLNIIFTQGSVIAEYFYPIEIQSSSKIKVSKFSVSEDVRLYDIYNFAFDLLKQESKNLSFNLETDYKQLASSKDFVVRIGPFEQQQGYSYRVVNIVDPKSYLGGDQFALQFLIVNRPPLVEKADDPPIPKLNNLLPKIKFNEFLCSKAKDPDDSNFNVSLRQNPQISLYEVNCKDYSSLDLNSFIQRACSLRDSHNEVQLRLFVNDGFEEESNFFGLDLTRIRCPNS